MTSGFKRLFSHWSNHSLGLEQPSDTGDIKEKEKPQSSKTKTVVPPQQRQSHLKANLADVILESVMIPMMPLYNVLRGATKYFMFHFVRILMLVFYAVYHRLNGTYRKMLESQKPENYEWSARVYDVIFKFKYDQLVNDNRVSDLALRHAGFDHPNCVLADEVSLYYVDEKIAVFIEAPPGVEVWRGDVNAFHTIGQINVAKRVIILPISSIYKLADQLGDPKGKLVFITNTARCGSTLLSRIFEESGSFVSLSEPTAINMLQKYVGREDDPWVQSHTRAIIRILCKPTHVDNYAIKITPTSSTIVPLMRRVYPDAGHIFIYRDGLPVARSMFKIWLELPLGYVNILLARYIHDIYIHILNWTGYYPSLDTKLNLRLSPGYGQACYYWSSSITQYLDFRKAGHPIAAVKYEDLVADKHTAVTKLFQFLDVPLDLVKPALKAFAQDAQKSSMLSIKNLSKFKVPELTPTLRQEADKICDYFGLAKFGESCVIDGTLTREDVPRPGRSTSSMNS